MSGGTPVNGARRAIAMQRMPRISSAGRLGVGCLDAGWLAVGWLGVGWLGIGWREACMGSTWKFFRDGGPIRSRQLTHRPLYRISR
ncbi:hypothetical protein CLM73_22720 [Achromobacter spanius]|uniref:Uncharacterized protein n=1 Tax=Achromobacter spanius TaxID=217203 RepID=A0A2S0ICH2_9BURK|nr:hypothetical protein CLM73_22720 [Achromobacter spanius]